MWAYHDKVQIDFSRPGSPPKSFIKTFNGSFRDEHLNLHWFESLAEAKREIGLGAATTMRPALISHSRN